MKKFGKFKNILYYLLILIIILCVHFYNFSNTTANDQMVEHFNRVYLENEMNFMYYKQELLQAFVAKEDNLYKIKIYLDGISNASFNNSYMEPYFAISLEDDDNNVIQEYKYGKVFLNDDGSFDFEFDTIKKSSGKKYYIRIKNYHPTKLMNIVLEKNSDESNEIMLVNNKKVEGHMIFTSVYKVKKTNSLFWILTFIIIIIFTFIYILFVKRKIPIEKQYLIISVIVCLLMIFLTVPFAGHDEIDHFARIYELTNGSSSIYSGDDWLYVKIPEEVINKSLYEQLPAHLVSDGYGMRVDMQYTSVYSAISYIPQIIAQKVAQFLIPNSFYWSYFIRLVQAFFCIFCTYYAIKIIPFGKKTLFFITLIPTYIQAISFISVDALLVSLSLLFFAKILQLGNSKNKIRKKDYLLLSVLSIVIGVSKLVYIPLCLFLLYLVYKKKEDKIPIIIILACTCCFVVLWNFFALKNLSIGQGGNAIYYIKEILLHPLNFIQIMLYSFFSQIGNHLNDLFGGVNSWFDNVIYDSSVFPILFLILYLYILNNNENELDNKDKILMIIIILGTILLISISIYISCTPVKYDSIIGIQGRYFLPLLLPLCLLVPKSNNKKIFNVSAILSIIYLAYYLNYIVVFL